MQLNPVETIPLDTLVGVYGTVLNETNHYRKDPNDNMGQHFCFGYYRKDTYCVGRNFKTTVHTKKQTKFSRTEFVFDVSPGYFYYLNVVNIVGWFYPPQLKISEKVVDGNNSL